MQSSELTYQPYPGDPSEKRPGLQLFWMRSIVLGLCWILASVLLATPASHEPSVAEWAVSIFVRFSVMFTFFYHLYLTILFKRLSYVLSADALIISGLFPIRLPYKNISKATLIVEPLELHRVFAYAKESPQLIHFVAQTGFFKTSGSEVIRLISTLAHWRRAEGLVLVTLNNGITYGISPEDRQGFMKEIEKKISAKRADHERALHCPGSPVLLLRNRGSSRKGNLERAQLPAVGPGV